MKSAYFTTIFLVYSILSFSQPYFEKGYFINNADEKQECLIKNVDKASSLQLIEYKSSAESEIRTANLEDIKEFEIYNTNYKYRRFAVDLDTSSRDLQKLSQFKQPEYKKVLTFLRVSFEGTPSLYVYHDKVVDNKFYLKTEENIIPLTNKKFLSKNGAVTINDSYKQILKNVLQCIENKGAFVNVSYTEKSIVKLFEQYHISNQLDYINYRDKKRKGLVNFRLKAGMNNTALLIKRNIVKRTDSGGGSEIFEIEKYSGMTDRKSSPQIGLEIEYVLPSRHNRWSLFFEPTFQYFEHQYDSVFLYSTYEVQTSSGQFYTSGYYNSLEVNYSQIMLPIGIKYYVLQNRSSKLFLISSLSYNILLNNEEAIKMTASYLEESVNQSTVNIIPAIIIGAGYSYKKFSIELGYNVFKQMLENNDWEIFYKKSVQLSIGYTLN